MSELILLYFIPYAENQAFFLIVTIRYFFLLNFCLFYYIISLCISLENPRRFTDGYFRLERSILAEPSGRLMFETQPLWLFISFLLMLRKTKT